MGVLKLSRKEAQEEGESHVKSEVEANTSVKPHTVGISFLWLLSEVP